MLSGRITQGVLRIFDKVLPVRASKDAPTRRTGRHGEEDAYFYLRRHGYVMVARNYRSPRHHGEIDLIGWNNDVLCFVEVKTRTTHDVKPAEAAVDRDKRRAVRRLVGDYLRGLPRRQYSATPPWRFDVITVYYEGENSDPQFEVFQNAALSA